MQFALGKLQQAVGWLLPQGGPSQNEEMSDESIDLEPPQVIRPVALRQPTPIHHVRVQTPADVQPVPIRYQPSFVRDSVIAKPSKPNKLKSKLKVPGQARNKPKNTVRIAPNQERHAVKRLKVRTENIPIDKLYVIGDVIGPSSTINTVTRWGQRMRGNREKVVIKQVSLLGLSKETVHHIIKDIDTMVLIRCDDENECTGHAFVWDVFAVGRPNQVPQYLFLVLEYIDGENIRTLLHKHLSEAGQNGWKPHLRRFFNMVIPLIHTLRELHEKGALIRNIKPTNLRYDKKRKRLVLTGFGLACLTRNTAYTDPRTILTGVTDIWSDIYSLGVTLFEIVTDRPYIDVFMPTVAQFPEYNTHKMSIDLKPILEQYNTTDPEYTMLVAIRMMTVPFDHMNRPSLLSVLNAVEKSDWRLLNHSGDTEHSETGCTVKVAG